MTPIQSRIDALEGIANGALVGWYARSLAVATRDGVDVEAAAAILNAPAEIRAKIKSVVESTITQPGLAGSSAAVTAFVGQAAGNSILLRMISDRATYQLPLHTRVMSPAADIPARVVGEGQAVPVYGFSLDFGTLTPFKVGAAIAATDELLRNTSSAGQAFLNQMLRNAVARGADKAMLDRLTDPMTLDAPAARNDPDGVLTAYGQALQLVATRATDRIYLAFGVRAANWLSTLPLMPEGANPISGSFLARPAVVTDALDPWKIAVINASAFVAAVDRLEIRATREATVELSEGDEDPRRVSLWQSGAAAIRTTLSLAVEKIRDDAVAFVDMTPEES